MRIFQFSLITIASFISCFVELLPSNAATFSNSEASLLLDNFNILPQNPNADSNREAIASGNQFSIADASGDGTLAFINDKDNAFLKSDFNSSASGNGSNYYSLGASDSLISSTFLVEENDTLSFDFLVSLKLKNKVDSEFDGSVTTYTEVSFSLFDNLTNAFLGDLAAVGNINTNLANNINNDTIFATSNLNFTIDSLVEEKSFTENKEFANLDIAGSIQQTFTTATQVRLQASTFNLSCTQSIQNSDPCIKTTVPESSNVLTLTIGFLGISAFYIRRINKKNNSVVD